MNEKKYFSVSLFIHNFLSLKLVGILSTVLIAIFSTYLIVDNGSYMARVCAEKGLQPGAMTTGITVSSLTPLLFTFIFVMPILMIMAFNYNNKRNSSDFYNSLPYTRLNMYLTKTAAVLAWICIVFVVSCIGIVAAMAVYKEYFIYSVSTLVWAVIGIFICNIVCGASIAFGCSLTGNVISNICISGIIMFLPVTIRQMAIITVQGLFYYTSNIVPVPVIGSEKNILSDLILWAIGIGDGGVSSVLTDKGNMLYSLILSVILFVAGYYCFRARKSEMAGKASSGNKVQMLIRCVIGFVILEFALMLLVMGDFDNMISVVILIGLGFVAVLVYEMMTGDKSGIIKKSLVSFGVAGVLAAAFMSVVYGGVSSMKSYRADAEKISYVTFESMPDRTWYSSGRTYDYYESKVNDLKITDKRVIEKVAQAYNECSVKKPSQIYAVSSTKEVYVMDVYFKDGMFGTRREVYIYDDMFDEITALMCELEEYQNIYMTLPEADHASFSFNNDVAISKESARKLYESMKEEISRADFSKYMEARNKSSVCDTITVTFMEDDCEYKIKLPFNNIVPDTTAMYMRMTNESSMQLKSSAVDFETVKKFVMDITEDKSVKVIGESVDISIIYIDIDKEIEEHIYSNSMYASTPDADFRQLNSAYADQLKMAREGLNNLTADSKIDPSKPFYQINVHVYTGQNENTTYSSSAFTYYLYIQ